MYKKKYLKYKKKYIDLMKNHTKGELLINLDGGGKYKITNSKTKQVTEIDTDKISTDKSSFELLKILISSQNKISLSTHNVYIVIGSTIITNSEELESKCAEQLKIETDKDKSCSVLYLIRLKPQIQLHFKSITDDKIFSKTFAVTTTVAQLKKIVASNTGLSVKMINLTSGETELKDDNKTLFDLKLRSESIIVYNIKLKTGYESDHLRNGICDYIYKLRNGGVVEYRGKFINDKRVPDGPGKEIELNKEGKMIMNYTYLYINFKKEGDGTIIFYMDGIPTQIDKGQFLKDKFVNGIRTINDPDGLIDIVDGVFVDNRLVKGTRTITQPNGLIATYEGKFKYNEVDDSVLVNGIHKLILPDKTTYTYRGNFVDNYLVGKGISTLTLPYPDKISYTYEGEFKDNNLYGQGKMTVVAGDNSWSYVYIGAFKNGDKHGQGKQTQYNDGNISNIYEGNFENNLKHGKGKQTYYNAAKEINFIDEGTWDKDHLVLK